MPEHYDVIVIGSGAGGGTLTHALAPTGKRILLIERGGYLPREKQNWEPRSIWADLRYRNSGEWLDETTGTAFTPKQHYYVGGNTKVYGAVLLRFRERDFDEVRHVDGISPAWPLKYGDFEQWYTRAEELYAVHGERGIDPTEPPATGPYPHPPISDEPRIARLRSDLAGVGLTPFPLPMGILIDEAHPQTSPCIRCDTCDGYPCPVHAKADAEVMCVEPALRHPNVELLTHTRVTRLDTDPSGHSITRIVAEREGRAEEFSADVVVLAAGAINSAAILLASACDRHPDGLANSSGVVGRHLMLHNNSSLIAISEEPNPTTFQKTLGINDFYFERDDWAFPRGAMQMLGKSDPVMMGVVAPDAGDPADLAAHSLDFWLTSEDLPRADNRVTLGRDGQITLAYTPTNLEAHDRLLAEFRALLTSIGCRQDVYDHATYLGGRVGIAGVTHQNGTIRFGTDPGASALDLDCKAHDVDNLYVVDSSFFASSTATNPTLTIVANALRVADRIGARLGASEGIPIGVAA